MMSSSSYATKNMTTINAKIEISIRKARLRRFFIILVFKLDTLINLPAPKISDW